MELASFRSKPLQRFWERGIARGLPVQNAEKVRRLLSFLADMADIEEFLALPLGRPHRLTGDREGTYAVSITANWRLTFVMDGETLRDLDFEDCH